jgi:hypothetical protein
MVKNLILALLYLCPTILFCQKHLVKTNPILFCTGFINGTYEYAFKQKSSVGFSVGLGFFDGSIATAGSIEYRYYPSKTNLIPMKGLYIGPHLFAYSYEGDGNAAFGALIGYQWIWKTGVSLDLGIGPQLSFNSSTTNPYGVISLGYVLGE